MGARRQDSVMVSAFRLGLMGRCPRCSVGPLFSSYLTLRKSCPVCGLDYSFADPADGPAFFAMTISAFPAVGFGLWIEFTFNPPLWVHFVTTGPFLVFGCVALLRPLKGWLVCSQYLHKSGEGRLASKVEPGTDRPDRPT
jgi:uncharacterized protein (DUF983 family)